MPKEREIVGWLRKAGLTKYCAIFVREEIDMQALRLLGDNDLQRLGIRSLGPRRKILQLIATENAASAGGTSGPGGASHDGSSSSSSSSSMETERAVADSGGAGHMDDGDGDGDDDEDDIKLTQPLPESNLVKRHCASNDGAAAGAAGSMWPAAAPGAAAETSLASSPGPAVAQGGVEFTGGTCADDAGAATADSAERAAAGSATASRSSGSGGSGSQQQQGVASIAPSASPSLWQMASSPAIGRSRAGT
eukprot:SAG22_NODE_5829_length_946_cov_1.388430_1_plen_249_part_01